MSREAGKDRLLAVGSRRRIAVAWRRILSRMILARRRIATSLRWTIAARRSRHL